MKKQLVIRAKKQLVVRKPIRIANVIKGKFKGLRVRLTKCGFSGWFGKRVDTGEEIYLFREEVG